MEERIGGFERNLVFGRSVIFLPSGFSQLNDSIDQQKSNGFHFDFNVICLLEESKYTWIRKVGFLNIERIGWLRKVLVWKVPSNLGFSQLNDSIDQQKSKGKDWTFVLEGGLFST